LRMSRRTPSEATDSLIRFCEAATYSADFSALCSYCFIWGHDEELLESNLLTITALQKFARYQGREGAPLLLPSSSLADI
jgi:hypothetical protein